MVHLHGMLDAVFDGIGRGESCERLSRLGALDTASLTLGTKLVRHYPQRYAFYPALGRILNLSHPGAMSMLKMMIPVLPKLRL